MSNSIYHTDQNLKQFFEWLEKQDFYSDTVVVIQGDHTSMAAEYIHRNYDSHFDRRIWNTFIHSCVTPNKEKNREFTTMDLFPTVLAALGYKIKDNRAGLGTNLMSEEKTLSEKLTSDYMDSNIRKKSKLYREMM